MRREEDGDGLKLWLKIVLGSLVGLAFGAAAVAGGLYWYWCSAPETKWSSESAEARAEIDAGFKDFEKAYLADASLHFQRARELDPKSPAALVLHGFTLLDGDSEIKTIRQQLGALDRSRFTEFEAFLVRLFEAETRRDSELFRVTVDDYLSRHPKDALAGRLRCDVLWDRKSWDEAEACYRALLTDQPQWVQAQDRLGQLAMSRGRFAEAEDHFITYRYVAHNQAGPYSSIGVLYMLTGRYEESEAAFKKAIEVKHDYCPALSGLTHLYTVWGKLDAALEAIALTEAQPICRGLGQSGYTCSRKLFNAYLRKDLAKAEALDASCPAPLGYSLGKHQLAVWQGHFAEAEAMEAAIARDAGGDPAKQPTPFLAGFWHYFRGVRLLFADEYDLAADEFAAAEGQLRYWSGDTAILSCTNDVHRVYALELAGRDEEARALRQKIGAVNPRLLQSFRIPVLEDKLAEQRAALR